MNARYEVEDLMPACFFQLISKQTGVKMNKNELAKIAEQAD